jgi:hypothetical protein
MKDVYLAGPDVLGAVEILHGAAGEQQREEALALHLLLPVRHTFSIFSSLFSKKCCTVIFIEIKYDPSLKLLWICHVIV